VRAKASWHRAARTRPSPEARCRSTTARSPDGRCGAGSGRPIGRRPTAAIAALRPRRVPGSAGTAGAAPASVARPRHPTTTACGWR